MNASWIDTILAAPPAAMLLVKMTLLLAAGWGLHFALARRSPRWRVLLWRGLALGLVALPLLAASSPEWRVPLLPAPRLQTGVPDFVPPLLPRNVDARVELGPVHEEYAPPTPEPASPAAWAALAWGALVLLCLARFACAQRVMMRLCREAVPASEPIQQAFDRIAAELGVAGVRLAVSAAVSSPLLHGLRRPVVLLPASMTRETFAADLPAIFAHELHHVAARDLAWLGLVRLIQIALWPHPLVWRLHAACSAAAERACDAAAARALENREAYSRSLARVALALAGRPIQPAALAMAIPDIRRRLIALQQARATAIPARGAVRMAAVAALAGVVALGALRPVQAEPKREEAGGSSAPGSAKAEKTKLGLHEYYLGWRTEKTITDPQRAMARQLTENIKAYLRARTDEKTARAEGRLFDFDAKTLYVKITDTPEHLNQISAYLDSVPEIGKATRQETKFLKYAVSEDLATVINERILKGDAVREDAVTLKPGEQREIGGMTLTLQGIEPENPLKLQHARAALRLMMRDGSFDLKLMRGEQRPARHCLVAVDEIVEGASPTARIRVKYPKNPAAVKPDAIILDGISINPFGEMNVLILRYTDRGAYEYVMSLIAESDKPGAGQGAKLAAMPGGGQAQPATSSTVASPNSRAGKVEVPLKYAKAVDLAETIRRLIKITWGSGDPLNPVEEITVEPVPGKNAILISSRNPARVKDVADLIWVLDKPDEDTPLLAKTVTINTGGKVDLEEFLKRLTAAASAQMKVEMKYKINNGAAGAVACDFRDKKLSEILDTTLLPIGLAWDMANKTIYVWPKRKTAVTPTSGPQSVAAVRTQPEEKLETGNFSLMPRDTKVASAQIKKYGERVVDAIKTFLYEGDGAEAKANALGRRLWYDPETMNLTIVDTPDQLARVAQYTDILPALASTSKQEVIFLKYAGASQAAMTLMNQIKAPGERYTIGLKLKAGSSEWFEDFSIGAESIELGDPKDPKDDRATVFVRERVPNRLHKQTVTRGTKLTAGGCDFTVLNFAADIERPKEKWVQVQITCQARAEAPLPGARKMEKVTVDPFSELNALVVHATNEDEIKTIKKLAEAIDVPVRQIQLKTLLIENGSGSAGELLYPVADLGAILGDFTSAEIKQPESKDAKLVMTPVKLAVLNVEAQEAHEKIKARMALNRGNAMNGPVVASLNHQEAVFRMEHFDPNSPTAPLERPSKTTVLRVVPGFGQEKGSITLKNLRIDLEEITEGKKLYVARVFDVALKDGQSVLLTAPEFGGRSILLTASIIK